MNEGTIALIGAGNGGLALLKVLLDIPGVKIKYVCDINTEAVGFIFAKEHNIKCITDYEEIIRDKEINLIFEASGNPKVFEALSNKKSLKVSLIGGDGSKIIYNLLDAYNEVNQNLEEYKDNLEIKIIERTEDLERANANLEKEMLEYEKISQKLQEINVEKSKYLLYATHQLKAPFAAIQSYVDIILEGYSGDISQRTKDIVLKIKERCELLSNVIKEMLDLSKLKSRDTGERHFKKLNINPVLSNVVDRFQVIAANKNISINFERPEEDYFIRGNESQLDVLFATLIDNAINYSPANTAIEVILKKMGSSQIYAGIKDHGIGIHEKNIEKIFNEFFRSNNAVDFHNNGTGLGLSIAKEIASIHNTTIQVESKLNEGSCFSLIFQLV
ncbi:MAG: sensor histidine kinase [Candidatus Humimicrobiaceae bacterium]